MVINNALLCRPQLWAQDVLTPRITLWAGPPGVYQVIQGAFWC